MVVVCVCSQNGKEVVVIVQEKELRNIYHYIRVLLFFICGSLKRLEKYRTIGSPKEFGIGVFFPFKFGLIVWTLYRYVYHKIHISYCYTQGYAWDI